MNYLQLIAAINSLLHLATNAGIAWTQLRAAIDKANAEGRPFDITDLEPIADAAHAELAKLREQIAAAKAANPGPPA